MTSKEELSLPISGWDERSPGVTIIVPSVRTAEHLTRALESIVEQTLDHQLIEVIVIENGAGGSVGRTIEQVRQLETAPMIEWKWFRSERPGAARARNVGLAASTREFITFLDDDDWLERNYLSRLMEVADDSTIAITGIVNWGETGFQGDNTLFTRAKALPGRKQEITSAPWVLGFVASKLVPWQLVKDLAFPERLGSGEDVVFFGQVLSNSKIYVRPVDEFDHACYCRSVDGPSVSRGRNDFNFSVSERLEVIRLLSDVEIRNPRYDSVRGSLVRSQAKFVRDYYDRVAPAEQKQVLDEIAAAAIEDFPWFDFDRGQASKLVFAYCFPPDADTSSNVMAKRLMDADQLVDVISNDMSAVRAQDHKFYAVVKRWVNRHVVIDTPTSFANWQAISQWANAAVHESEQLENEYKEVYSRALWLASHVAGCIYKLKHPDTRWIAEFSDPLSVGADGLLRPGEIGNDATAKRLLSVISEPENGKTKTLFQVVEEASLLLADEVVFTNHSQMDVILESYQENFRDGIRRKATVARHPVPRPFLYNLASSDHLASEKLTVAYFGEFYPNRGVGSVVEALIRLPDAVRERFELAIFTNSDIQDVSIEGVQVKPQLSYLEFLAATQESDVLLVTDTSTSGMFSENPFLPSKVADYLGSGTPIWGIVEQGSPLSRIEMDYVCIGSADKITETLHLIAQDFETAQ